MPRITSGKNICYNCVQYQIIVLIIVIICGKSAPKQIILILQVTTLQQLLKEIGEF